MKRILVSLAAAALCAGICGSSFAQVNKPITVNTFQPKAQVLKGRIIAIDNAKNEVTIQDKAGKERIFLAETKQIASLKQQDEVKVALLPGSNTAKNIKVVSDKHHKKTK